MTSRICAVREGHDGYAAARWAGRGSPRSRAVSSPRSLGVHVSTVRRSAWPASSTTCPCGWARRAHTLKSCRLPTCSTPGSPRSTWWAPSRSWPPHRASRACSWLPEPGPSSTTPGSARSKRAACLDDVASADVVIVPGSDCLCDLDPALVEWLRHGAPHDDVDAQRRHRVQLPRRRRRPGGCRGRHALGVGAAPD